MHVSALAKQDDEQACNEEEDVGHCKAHIRKDDPVALQIGQRAGKRQAVGGRCQGDMLDSDSRGATHSGR